MVKFTTIIQQFAKQGEKTGWTYIDIPQEIAEKIAPGNKKSIRVKGKLDSYSFEGISLLPMGGGDFILTLNGDVRKHIKKRKGDSIKVQLEIDPTAYELNNEFIECLKEEPEAYKFFNSLNKSRQGYFSKWIDSAKTEETKAKRIAQAINGLMKHMDYGAMIRSVQEERKML
ncbi:MAG: DUF1905 domain-containing protein [Filimonas sp.]|nr:DUF1905 domain-containing protein [Filimonas sp.]